MKHWLNVALITLLLGVGCNRGSDSEGAAEPNPDTTSANTTPVAAEDIGQNTAVNPQTADTHQTQDFSGPTTGSVPSRFGSPRDLDISNVLTRGEVREATRFTGTLQETTLEGQKPSRTYNSIRFAGDGHLGVGLQVWEFSSSAATTRHFERLRDTYVEPRGTRTVGDGGFRSDYTDIRQIVFMSRSRNLVIAIACDETVCPTDQEIIGLAEKAEDNL